MSDIQFTVNVQSMPTAWPLGAPVYNYYISGTVTGSDGNPAERTIRIYNRNTGALLDDTTSDAGDGSFDFQLGTVGPMEYYVVAVADGAEEPDLIYRVTSGTDD